MSGEVYLVPVASISGHTKPRDNMKNSLYQQYFDALQSLNGIKSSQYIILLPKDLREKEKYLLEVIWKTSRLKHNLILAFIVTCALFHIQILYKGFIFTLIITT